MSPAQQTLKDVMPSSTSDLELEEHRRLSVVDPDSADQKFRYFKERVIRCQIWRDEEGSLFTRLKNVAQDLMDSIAVRCNGRSVNQNTKFLHSLARHTVGTVP